MRRCIFLGATALALHAVPPLAHAAWLGPWGTPVAPALHGYPVALAQDGAGGVLVAYQGVEVPGGPAIRVQRVLADGSIAAGWPAEGVVACSLTTTRTLGVLQAVSDGSGGAYLVWNENAFMDQAGSGYGQHVLADGSRATGWPARGRALVTGGVGQRYHQALPSGGALLVAWTENHTVRALRILANGVNAPGFPASGRLVWDPLWFGTSGEPQFSLVPDGSGGTWAAAGLVSADTLQFPSSYRLLHLEPSGALDAVWLGDGYGVELPLPASACVSGGARVLADGADGAYVLALVADRAMLMHVTSSQVPDPDWPSPWLDLGDASDVSGTVAGLEADGAGGLYALWRRPALGLGRGALRRVRTDGTLDAAWPSPLPVTATAYPTLLADAAGVFVSGTYFYTCPHQNCLGVAAVMRRSPDGSVPAGWPAAANGLFLPGEYGLPDSAAGGPVSIVSDGAGGIYAAWTTPDAPAAPYGGPGQVRVMRFAGAGPVAGVVGGAGSSPGVLRTWFARDGLHVGVPGSAAAATEVTVHDLSGRRIALATGVAGDVLVPGTARLAPGVYLVRLRGGATESRAKAVVVR